MTPASTPKHAAAFRRRLLAWFRRAGRDLPWRRTRDPYAVAVSEFMLQQTQVSRVLEYYEPFLRKYPTVERLARARPLAVREAWDGLGYYRRAANLHRLARTVVRDHGGTLPADAAQLRALPGVGAYTAGAVLAFAYERPAAAVDTNVGRVLQRFFGVRASGRAGVRKGRTGGRADGRTGGARRLEVLALALQPKRGATIWAFNQALMELGALICTARRPRCPTCPVRAGCCWRVSSARRPTP